MEVKSDCTWTPSHIGLIVRSMEESINHDESLGFFFQPQVDRDSSRIAAKKWTIFFRKATEI
jgi:hypothetical protein